MYICICSILYVYMRPHVHAVELGSAADYTPHKVTERTAIRSFYVRIVFLYIGTAIKYLYTFLTCAHMVTRKLFANYSRTNVTI